MRLYPFKFTPILKSIIWGGSRVCQFKNIVPEQDGIGESWEISGVKGDISVVDDGSLKGKNLEELIETYKEQIVGKRVYEKFGTTFPLLIKFIDAHDNLSIQVHPNDELAKQRHNSLGKTEMWYVIDADPDAFIYSGFSKKLNPEDFFSTVEDKTFINYLAKYEIQKGDSFFLPAGRIHSLGKGGFVAEIQETSNITYRIYDYDRTDAEGNPRDLHTKMAKDAIDYQVHDNYKIQYTHNENELVQLETCPYFTTDLLELDKTFVQELADRDSFVILICMDGACEVKDARYNQVSLKQGETLLIPAANTSKISIMPKGKVQLLQTYA